LLKRFFPPTQQQQQAAEQAKQAKLGARAMRPANGQASAADGRLRPSSRRAVCRGEAVHCDDAVDGVVLSGRSKSIRISMSRVHNSRRARSEFCARVIGRRRKNSGPYEMVAKCAGRHLPLGVVMTREGQVSTTATSVTTPAAGENRCDSGTGTTAISPQDRRRRLLTQTFTFNRRATLFSMIHRIWRPGSESAGRVDERRSRRSGLQYPYAGG